MSADASLEKKMELIQMIRNEQQDNNMSLKRREQILYPDTVFHERSFENPEIKTDKVVSSRSSFLLRFILAAILFLLFFYMDYSHVNIGILSSEKIQQMTTEVFPSNIFDFTKQFPYTLIEK